MIFNPELINIITEEDFNTLCDYFLGKVQNYQLKKNFLVINRVLYINNVSTCNLLVGGHFIRAYLSTNLTNELWKNLLINLANDYAVPVIYDVPDIRWPLSTMNYNTFIGKLKDAELKTLDEYKNIQNYFKYLHGRNRGSITLINYLINMEMLTINEIKLFKLLYKNELNEIDVKY